MRAKCGREDRHGKHSIMRGRALVGVCPGSPADPPCAFYGLRACVKPAVEGHESGLCADCWASIPIGIKKERTTKESLVRWESDRYIGLRYRRGGRTYQRKDDEWRSQR